LRQPDALRQLKCAETDPDLESVHDDPRFVKLMRDARKHLGPRHASTPAAAAVSANSPGS
jgi:hypothetical protein